MSQIDLQLNPRKSEMTVIKAPTLSKHNHVITRMSDMMPGIVEVLFDSMPLLGSAMGDENYQTWILVLPGAQGECSSYVNV